MSQLDEKRCWQAVVARDGDYDGRFFFGVITTGVFCRPSCRSRRPLRKNVRFFLTMDQARQAGLRPCLRCRPSTERDPDLELVSELCAHIRAQSGGEEDLTLPSLARRTGKSPSQLRRLFRELVGVSPRQYLEACRLESFRTELRAGESVTDAVYEAGFGSNSRVYERIDARFGMTPTQYRDGGPGLKISYAWLESDFGLILVAATDRGLCCVELGASRDELLQRLRDEFPAASMAESESGPEDPHFRAWSEALRQHLESGVAHFDLPIDLRASAFRIKVWRYLQSIPRGEVRSYGEVATAVGRPRGARAVAQACAANRLALVIPCHRVIRGDGTLGGYRWGTERKRRLLEREGAVASQ